MSWFGIKKGNTAKKIRTEAKFENNCPMHHKTEIATYCSFGYMPSPICLKNQQMET